SLLANKSNKDLRDFTAKLIKFRREHPALANDNFQVVLSDSDRRIFAFKRWNDAGSVAVIVANLKDTPSAEFTIEKAGLEDGKWLEYLTNQKIEMKNGQIKTTLEPSQIKVFVKE
ncbi:MAG TPA: DUF3459 domain-containing protein, partial [Tepidisphaeraceae bacterium]